MKGLNLTEWAIRHRALAIYFMLMSLIAGVTAYLHLGRNEDPEFTVKTMVVVTMWPGATQEETMQQVTDRIEKKLQDTPSLYYLKSYTVAGQSTIFVYLLESTPKKDVPDLWYQVRKKVGDIKQTLPQGIVGPFFIHSKLGLRARDSKSLRGNSMETKEQADSEKDLVALWIGAHSGARLRRCQRSNLAIALSGPACPVDGRPLRRAR